MRISAVRGLGDGAADGGGGGGCPAALPGTARHPDQARSTRCQDQSASMGQGIEPLGGASDFSSRSPLDCCWLHPDGVVAVTALVYCGYHWSTLRMSARKQYQHRLPLPVQCPMARWGALLGFTCSNYSQVMWPQLNLKHQNLQHAHHSGNAAPRQGPRYRHKLHCR